MNIASSSPSLKLVKAALIALLSLFAPAKGMVITAFVLIIVDLITGVLAARKRGEQITSRGFRRTLTKGFIYEVALLLAFLTEQYLTLDILPAAKIVSSFIGVTELKSVYENLDELSGGNLLKNLIKKLNGPDDQ